MTSKRQCVAWSVLAGCVWLMVASGLAIALAGAMTMLKELWEYQEILAILVGIFIAAAFAMIATIPFLGLTLSGRRQ